MGKGGWWMMGGMDEDVDSLGKMEVRKKEKRIQRRGSQEKTELTKGKCEMRYWNQLSSEDVE
jgi:hypothetical protein